MAFTAYPINNLITINNFYSFFERHYDNGYTFAGESHDFWECVYVLKGSIRASGDERIYELSEGSLIFHKPFELHKFDIINPTGTTLLIFSFSMEGSAADFFKDEAFVLTKQQKAIIDLLFQYFHTKGTVPCEDGAYAYLDHFAQATYSQMMTTFIYQLFLSLLEENMKADLSKTQETRIFKKAVNYMNQNLHLPLSVSDIARFCNVSESSLKRVFHKFAGASVHRHFLLLKLNTATNMLQSGYSVTEVAELSGFRSQNYFSTTYKREMGIRPSEVPRK